MAKATYTAADLASPKVCGLAVHRAKLVTERDLADVEAARDAGKTVYPIPGPVLPYCLFGIKPDCDVLELASSATAGEMAAVISKRNLVLLAKKYNLIGYVVSRTPKKRREYEILHVPKEASR